MFSSEKMIKVKRRLTAWFILFLLLQSLFSLPVFAYSIPKQTAGFYANDFADILSKETEDYAVSVNERLFEKTGAQVVIVTIPSLEGASIEEYSTDMFRQYGIGSADKNNGVLLLLSLKDRECRIEVGYGLEGALNDAKCGRIMDQYMIPYFKDQNWDAGMKNGFDAVIDVVCDEYDIEIDRDKPVASQGTDSPGEVDESQSKWDRFEPLACWSLAIAFVFGLFVGKFLPGKGTIANLLYFAGDFAYFKINYGIWYALLALFGALIFLLIGWAITSPDIGGGGSSDSGGSLFGGSSSSSHSHSHHSSGGHYGGGGRSGGGGASRRF